jgi:hypothetical protein
MPKGLPSRSPDASLIGRRTQIMAARILHAMAWPPPAMLPDMMKSWKPDDREKMNQEFDAQAQDITNKLKSRGFWLDATRDEQEFFTARLLDRTERQYIDSAWLMESVACCLWTVGRLPELPGYDTQCGRDILKLVPKRADHAALVLRPRIELERARSIAELWHWRSRTRQLLEGRNELPELPEGLTLDAIVRIAAAKAAEAGDVPACRDGDFPAFGKPYRDLSREEYSIMTSIAVERHRALNWICGRAPNNRWDETPTDT